MLLEKEKTIEALRVHLVLTYSDTEDKGKSLITGRPRYC